VNWLQEITKQHNELESPSSFWYWSAIAAISAVVKDQIWMDRQIFKTYPNIYVMLHAESGLKKGPPIAMARQLVKPTGVRTISGRSSIQGILKDMGTSYTQPGGKIQSGNQVFICSSELSSSIVEDKVATKILTDLYDRQYNVGEWRSLLKMESFELKDPTITMLTATNEAMSEDFFTKSAIQGGYFARTFIIYEKDSQTVNSLIYPLSNPPNYSTSSDYLKELAKLKGQFYPIASVTKENDFKYRKIKQGRDIYFNSVGIAYDDWYDSFKENIRVHDLRDETGTMNRFGDSVLKVAMLLSLARAPCLRIDEESMNEAITECEKLLGNVRKTTLGKHGLSNTALLKSLIIMELLNRENHQVSRTVLMKKMWMHYENSEEFDNLMQSFDQAGLIKTNSIGNNIIYEMPTSQVEELKRFMAGKQK
jgi:hypothetical protein